jgi:hypothetical protein
VTVVRGACILLLAFYVAMSAVGLALYREAYVAGTGTSAP